MDSNVFYLTQNIKKIDDDTTKHTWKWVIPDFKWLANNQTNRDILTKKLEIKEDNNNEECKFQLKIQFVGHDNDLIEIYYKTNQSVALKCNCSIRIERSDEHCTKITSLSNKQYHFVRKNEWQLLGVLFKKQLEVEDGDKMKLQFEFVVCEKSNNFQTKLPNFQVSRKEDLIMPMMADCKLINCFRNLLMNMAFSDVTVKSLDGDEFPAHKNFLATRSVVFNAHFEHNTTESTSVVNFPFETDVLKDVLTYIYTDDAPNVEKLSRKLLEAAEFYQLNGLKVLCELALEKMLTVDNAIETLELANLYRTMYLRRKTLEFIKDGLAGDVTETEGWKICQSSEVIKSVYECIVKNKIY